jgi:hypothetical protein
MDIVLEDNMSRMLVVLLLLTALMVGMSQACAGGPPGSPTPTSSPTPPAVYSQYQLEYQLMAKYADFFWCDPDLYPITRPGQEALNAQQQFPDIQANAEEFSAILEHIGLTEKPSFTDAEKLKIYQEHKKLFYAVTLTIAGNVYNYSIRTGENQGLHIEGTVTSSGTITVLKQEPSFNTCPICLTKGTLIETPDGQTPVEQLQPGMLVLTIDNSGNRLTVSIIKISSTPVPPAFSSVKVTLEDGRAVTASPGHPTVDLKALGSYRVGDTLDGSRVEDVERLAYGGSQTYDLLPSGTTGLYWANGILLRSTLID